MKRVLLTFSIVWGLATAVVAGWKIFREGKSWLRGLMESALQGLIATGFLMMRKFQWIVMALGSYKASAKASEVLGVQDSPVLSVVTGIAVGFLTGLVWGTAAELLVIFCAFAVGDLAQEVIRKKRQLECRNVNIGS